ncbi:zona pellucida sperm-binding protein 3-like isoform X2 [Lepisosteus oculatus]|uniref:zona pellucida sperm-binding protein 3-like n=1 Tax=Lepisosteus oculatus TaxID=7918 RepID=UPI0035F523C8
MLSCFNTVLWFTYFTPVAIERDVNLAMRSFLFMLCLCTGAGLPALVSAGPAGWDSRELALQADLPAPEDAAQLEDLNLADAPSEDLSASENDSQSLAPDFRRLPVSRDAYSPYFDKEKMKPEAGSRPLPAYIKSVLFPPQRGRQPARPAIGGTRGVAVWCDSSRMYVRVSRLLFGFSCRPSEVTLGNCSVSRTTRSYFYFIYGLHECGTERSVVQGRLVYSNTLRYAPPSSSAPVHRFIPFSVPVKCSYNRFHYSYKVGYVPTWARRRTFFKDLKNKHSFVLLTTNSRWVRLSPKDEYFLGQPMYFQATAYFATAEQRLYIHSCYVTEKPDQHSQPRFPVIDNLGCMVDSKADGCLSRFVPSKQKDVLRFTIDAFLFQKKLSRKHEVTELYMHCVMAVAPAKATPGTKSCTYNREAKRWEELYGDHEVCACCESRCAGSRNEGTRSLVTSSRVAVAPVEAPLDVGADWTEDEEGDPQSSSEDAESTSEDVEGAEDFGDVGQWTGA